MANYKAALLKSLEEAGLAGKSGYGRSRTTFTYLRKNGIRRVKLWVAADVWEASQETQRKLEERLKVNYGPAYLGGYFIRMQRYSCMSFCILLDQSKLASK